MQKNKFISIYLRAIGGFVFLFGKPVVAQITSPDQDKIDIINIDEIKFKAFEGGVKIRKLLHNVHLRQDSTDFFCDSVYQYVDSNLMVAYSRVRIVLATQREITAQQLVYNTDNKVCRLYHNVVLKDSQATLRTDQMTYYRKEDMGKYTTGGELKDDENVLTSIRGTYYTKEKIAYFYDSVKLANPNFDMYTDSLQYNTRTETAHFISPATIYDSSYVFKTRAGYYDTQNKLGHFYERPELKDSAYTLVADTFLYDRNKDEGLATGAVVLYEQDSTISLYGQKGFFRAKAEESYLTDSAYGIRFFEEDTLFLFADTFYTYQDSLRGQRVISAYDSVRMFMDQAQGIGDSMYYLENDSQLFLLKDPVLWSGQRQLTGDTVILWLKNNTLDSVCIPQNAFIASEADSLGYSQIKGKRMLGKLRGDTLQKVWILGNCESVYYVKDNKNAYFGANQARCNDMVITFSGNEPERILFKGKTDGDFFPMEMIITSPPKLEGFVWKAEKRPKKPSFTLLGILFHSTEKE